MSKLSELAKELFGEMQNATPEEQEAVSNYISSISKPTGVNFLEILEKMVNGSSIYRLSYNIDHSKVICYGELFIQPNVDIVVERCIKYDENVNHAHICRIEGSSVPKDQHVVIHQRNIINNFSQLVNPKPGNDYDDFKMFDNIFKCSVYFDHDIRNDLEFEFYKARLIDIANRKFLTESCESCRDMFKTANEMYTNTTKKVEYLKTFAKNVGATDILEEILKLKVEEIEHE